MKIITDLSHLVEDKMPTFPGDPIPRIQTVATVKEQGYQEKQLTVSTHTGTHIDAPAHIFEHLPELDAVSLEHFIGQGQVLDVSRVEQRCLEADLLNAVQVADTIDFILFYSGWDKKWAEAGYFLDFPYLSSQLAEKLVRLKIKGVGLDFCSVDRLDDRKLSAHKILLKNGVIIIENLTNLHKLIGKTFTLVALPLKIAHADGAPARVIAIED